MRLPLRSTLFPYTTLFRSKSGLALVRHRVAEPLGFGFVEREGRYQDRKSTRLNSSHRTISYAVFCLKKKMFRLSFVRLGTFIERHHVGNNEMNVSSLLGYS